MALIEDNIRGASPTVFIVKAVTAMLFVSDAFLQGKSCLALHGFYSQLFVTSETTSFHSLNLINVPYLLKLSMS
jgi:hypothetical protein